MENMWKIGGEYDREKIPVKMGEIDGNSVDIW